jgi:hypothetical protein
MELDLSIRPTTKLANAWLVSFMIIQATLALALTNNHTLTLRQNSVFLALELEMELTN